MNGGCFDGRAGNSERKEKKKVFLSLVSLAGGGSCFLPLSNCSVRGRAFFLPYLAQSRQDQRLAGLLVAAACLLVCFFRWRRTSPTFQVPQRVKFLPLPTGTVLTSTWPYGSQVKTSKEFPTRLQVSWLGERMIAVSPDRAAILFLPPFFDDNFNIEISSMLVSVQLEL